MTNRMPSKLTRDVFVHTKHKESCIVESNSTRATQAAKAAFSRILAQFIPEAHLWLAGRNPELRRKQLVIPDEALSCFI